MKFSTKKGVTGRGLSTEQSARDTGDGERKGGGWKVDASQLRGEMTQERLRLGRQMTAVIARMRGSVCSPRN